MRLHQIGAQRVALILAIIAITCEISWAGIACKTAMMDMHMKRCRPGIRVKRGTESLDLQKHDVQSKRQEVIDYSKLNGDSASHGAPRKRQLSMLELGQVALPIVTEAMHGASRFKGIDSVLHNEHHDGLGLIDPGFGSLLPTSTADFDIDLNIEELDGYDDIYVRSPRTPKEETWKAFLEAASKCCQNIYKCLKESMHVPCLIR